MILRSCFCFERFKRQSKYALKKELPCAGFHGTILDCRLFIGRKENFDMKKYFTVKNLCLSGIIAALYAGLTILLQAISFQAVQVRVSEAMTLLPVLLPAAIPGLTVGCFLANILSPVGWMDMVFGTLATLIAAVLTRKFKKNLYLAALMPVLSNAVIIGVMLHVAFGEPLWMSMLTVGAGEALACFVLGIPLVKALEKVPGLKDE